MKIDTDLRAAIRAAEKAQPQTNRWEERAKLEQAAIADLFKRKPAIGAKVRRVVASITKAQRAAETARTKLCAEFGLRKDGDVLRFASCGDQESRFAKIGGKVPGEDQRKRWTFDAVMAELAKADPKEGKKIIKRLGINWS